MRWRTGVSIGMATAALALAFGATAAAAQTDVDLELVLAVDVSRSMDYDELELQRQGYVNAVKHPEVIQAIETGAIGRIAITYMEWAGPVYQTVLVPWTIVGNLAEAEAFSDRIAAAPLMRETGTSISGGLSHAYSLFAGSGVRSMRRVIDVSGDGPNNMGLPVVPMRDQIVAEGVTINGLPIMLKTSAFASPFSIPNLDVYYEDCVIGGPGAFMLTVEDAARFEVAIRRKLVLEIAGLPPRVIPAAMYQSAPRVDCMIGEKTRGRWYYEDR